MGNKSTKQNKDGTDVISENDVNKGTGEDNDESVVQKMKAKLEKVMESLDTKPQETVVENGTDSTPLIGNGIEPEKEADSTQNNIENETGKAEDVGKSGEPTETAEADAKPEEQTKPAEAETKPEEQTETDNPEKDDTKPEEPTETAETNNAEIEAKSEESTETTENNNVESEAKPEEPTEADKAAVEPEKDQESPKEQVDGEEKEKDDSVVANAE